MRFLTVLTVVALGGCTFGEATGLYDLPEETPIALQDAAYPELLTQQQIADRGIAPLTSAEQAVELASADALSRRAADVLQEEADRIQARAGALLSTAGSLDKTGPGLTPSGRALLARAARLRARAS